MELFSSALLFFLGTKIYFLGIKIYFLGMKKMANLGVSLVAQNCANFPIEAIMPLFTTIDLFFYCCRVNIDNSLFDG